MHCGRIGSTRHDLHYTAGVRIRFIFEGPARSTGMMNVLDLRSLPALRNELETTREAYKAQRATLRSTSGGRAKGMAGYALSKIGAKGRSLAAKVADLEAEALSRGVLV